MGIYIDKGNSGFRQSRNGEYVDKSGLIGAVNRTLFTERKFTCVTRCRRFGKSMAAKMLAAYYDRSCDSRKLFEDLEIAGDATGTAIDQTRQRQHPAKVSEYSGDMLLVAISYDKQTKEHQCRIETWNKP